MENGADKSFKKVKMEWRSHCAKMFKGAEGYLLAIEAPNEGGSQEKVFCLTMHQQGDLRS